MTKKAEIVADLKTLLEAGARTKMGKIWEIYDELLELRQAGVSVSDIEAKLNSRGFNLKPGNLTSYMHQIKKKKNTLGAVSQNKKPKPIISAKLNKVESNVENTLTTNNSLKSPAKLKPAAPAPVAVPARKLRCNPIPEGTALVTPFATAGPEFSQEGDLEHPALATLILTRKERMAAITLEYTDENGEVFSETPHEKRYRLTWRTPVPTTPSSTSANFTTMNMAIFGNQSG